MVGFLLFFMDEKRCAVISLTWQHN